MWYEPQHDNTNKWHVRPAKTQISLGIAVRLKKARVLSYSLRAQRILWLDCPDAQAELSLHWAHMSMLWFVMLLFKLNMEWIAIFESVSLPNIRPPGSNLPVLQLLHCHGNFTRYECRFQKYRIRLHIFNNDQVRNKTIWSRKTFSDSRPVYQLLFIRDALMVPGKKYHNRMISRPFIHPNPTLPPLTPSSASCPTQRHQNMRL